VVTTAIGALIQHDASHHRWSPYAKERWVLITSLDDFSRKFLYADLFEQETTWAHIKASQALMGIYGIPLRYYVDSLRVLRFVQGRDSFWRKHVLYLGCWPTNYNGDAGERINGKPGSIKPHILPISGSRSEGMTSGRQGLARPTCQYL
jgi:hypothetical protein